MVLVCSQAAAPTAYAIPRLPRIRAPVMTEPFSPPHARLGVLIVEVQLKKDDDKRYTWPAYLTVSQNDNETGVDCSGRSRACRGSAGSSMSARPFRFRAC